MANDRALNESIKQEKCLHAIFSHPYYMVVPLKESIEGSTTHHIIIFFFKDLTVRLTERPNLDIFQKVKDY